MWALAGVPALTAVLAAACALWPAARRFIWPILGLAALNVVLTPFTSGEWFYQHQEIPDYNEAVARGDFRSFDDLMGGHDPRLLPRMVAIAICLLLSLTLCAVLQRRASHGKPVAAVASAVAAGAVLLSALATLVQVYFIVDGHISRT